MPEPDSLEVIQERIRSLVESIRDTKEALRDLERRVRELETEELDALRHRVCAIEGKASSFESAKDESRDRWRTMLNFVVQLMWVVTAAFVLTKLGLDMGPT